MLIEFPDWTPVRGDDVESLMPVNHSAYDYVRNLGYDSHHLIVICMRNPEAYDADRWEAHWAAGLRGEAGHWPEPEDLILSVRE